MRRQTVFWAIALLSSVTAAQQDPAYVFQGVNLVTLDAEGVLAGQTVLIADGRIDAINGDSNGGERLVELRHRMVRIMHEEGVGLLLGSDAPQFFNVPGFSLHNELAYMVEAGLSPYEALRMGTVAPADFFDARDEFGRIAVGLAADLVLLAENPLSDVGAAAEPQGVMVRGRWLDRDALDAGLAAIADRHR